MWTSLLDSSWLADFSFALRVLFFPLTSFTVHRADHNCLSSTKQQILLVSLWMYSSCSFWHALVSSLWNFLSVYAMAFIGFLLLRTTFFLWSFFSLDATASSGNLYLAFSLIGMHSANVSLGAVTKYSYSSFGVCVSDVSWRELALFLTVTV